MEPVNYNDPEFQARVVLMHQYINGINAILKRVHNISGKRQRLFWNTVWDELGKVKDKPEITLEQVVAQQLKIVGRNKK